VRACIDYVRYPCDVYSTKSHGSCLPPHPHSFFFSRQNTPRFAQRAFPSLFFLSPCPFLSFSSQSGHVGRDAPMMTFHFSRHFSLNT